MKPHPSFLFIGEISMKKILFVLLFASFVFGYPTTKLDYETRISQLEHQIAVLNSLIKWDSATLEKYSALLETPETDEDYGEEDDEDDCDEECEEVNTLLYEKFSQNCITRCTLEYNKSWTQTPDSAHKCMDECMKPWYEE